jgi:CDP-glucose 4,6-dehydratase|tara:strand:+ start:3591 stop:4664 length:1074 start_codon:yes stop_codon:yes gene_type:complete
MEDVGQMRSFWEGKRVLLTGHTGFKGSWLSVLLQSMGAEVHGYALAPRGKPSFYELAGIDEKICSSTLADIRDYEALKSSLHRAQPDIVLHLAAQPLVRYSYSNPLETYSVNVMGTANLLQAALQSEKVRSVVNITTDKCYENMEWVWPYRENDRLGGHDPYSNSKACSELVTASFRESFFKKAGIGLASARAGNVIGGGDWSEDRLIPDFLRALDQNQVLTIRSPNATRPWQHVLEPLVGYLTLAESLYKSPEMYSKPFNFGPDEADAQTVEWIVEFLCSKYKNAAYRVQASDLHEAGMLRLDSSMTKKELCWKPRFNLQEALELTIDWHNTYRVGGDLIAKSLQQFQFYLSKATP